MPTSEQAGPLILDTHVWVEYFMGNPRLGRAEICAHIDQAAQQSLLLISAISVWEIGMLQSKGRLQMAEEPLAWARRALSVPGVSLLPLTPEIAIESTRLPGQQHLHWDPADRIIAASARLLGATVATRDQGLLDYAGRGFIKAMKV